MKTSTSQPTALRDPLAQDRTANPRSSDAFRQLFVIDSNVPDYEKIVATLPPGAEFHIPDSIADGLGQITPAPESQNKGL